MIRFRSFVLALSVLLLCWSPSAAQEKAWQTEVLQKLGGIENRLNTIDNRLNEMDKRYEIRFTKIEERFNLVDERFNRVDERFNRVEDKISAVNQRIDDKFNLIIGLLALAAAFLSLPFFSRLFEKFKPSAESKVVTQQLQELQDQINQIKTQLAQRVGTSV